MAVKASSTHKKVVVETFDGRRLPGYVNPRQLDRSEGMQVLDPAGEVQELEWKDVKVAWFVRDWEDEPARPDRTAFLRRPRLEGLWVRLRFRDNETLEGVIVNDLLNASPHGYLFTPPDLNGVHQLSDGFAGNELSVNLLRASWEEQRGLVSKLEADVESHRN
ncbi:MAG: hypothetical protein L0212_00340, partial [Acidobacteria bacterium]|nr:hypothetical protein [Acidobacteriota bacterium]